MFVAIACYLYMFLLCLFAGLHFFSTKVNSNVNSSSGTLNDTFKYERQFDRDELELQLLNKTKLSC